MLYQEKNVEITPFSQDTDRHSKAWAGPRLLQLVACLGTNRNTSTQFLSLNQNDFCSIFLN